VDRDEDRGRPARLPAVGEGGPVLEGDERVRGAGEVHLVALPGTQQRGEPAGHGEGHVLLTQPVRPDLPRVPSSVARVDDDDPRGPAPGRPRRRGLARRLGGRGAREAEHAVLVPETVGVARGQPLDEELVRQVHRAARPVHRRDELDGLAAHGEERREELEVQGVPEEHGTGPCGLFHPLPPERGQRRGRESRVAVVRGDGDANGFAGPLDRERGRLRRCPQRCGDQQEADQPDDHLSRLIARSISRCAARLFRSSRRSWSFLPRARARVTLA